MVPAFTHSTAHRASFRRVARRLVAASAITCLGACSSAPQDSGYLDLPLGNGRALAALADQEPRAAPDAELLEDAPGLLRWLAEHNAELAAARARIRGLESALDQSRLWPDPSLELGIAGINVGEANPPDLPARDSQSYSAGVHQPFEIGKRAPRIEAARLRMESERRRFTSLLGEKASQAREALARELYLRSKIAVMQENLDSARQMLDLEHQRLDQGDMSGNDFDRLSLDTTLLELDLPRARAEHAAALADVRAILGPESTPSRRGMEALESAASVPETVEVEPAIEARADHAAIALEMQAAAEDAKLAHRRAIPDPILGLEYTHDRLTEAGNQPDTLELTVGMNLPLFDRGQHDARRAEERRAELAETLRESVRQSVAGATELLEKRKSLAGILERIEKDAIPKSSQVLDASTAAYHRGQLSLTDVLLARRTHTDLVLREMDLKLESFGVRNELRRVLGIDSELGTELARSSNQEHRS
jgi:cobalt-zinc-cadmium efflux system outer membrane protein